MAPEHIVDWQSIAFFQFGTAKRGARFHELSLGSLIEHLGGTDSLTQEKLDNTRVIALRADDSPAHQWPASRCLYAEVSHGGHVYLLNAGKWYSIARNFIDEVNAAVKAIKTCKLPFPTYGDKSEGDYNARVSASDSDRFALADKELIRYGGGRSAIEFCDLYTVDRDIIHVKRYGGSTVFSHFFSQALVSGELFRRIPCFGARSTKSFPHRIGSHAPNQSRPMANIELFLQSSEAQAPLTSSRSSRA